METKLTPKEILICEEYFINGFNKTKAYQKGYPNYKGKSIYVESCKYFSKPHIKEYIENRLREIIQSSETITNKLITQLEYDCFERECDEVFTYNHKQKSMEMLIKLIKQQTEYSFKVSSNEDITIDVCFIDDDGNMSSPHIKSTNGKITNKTVVFEGEGDLVD